MIRDAYPKTPDQGMFSTNANLSPTKHLMEPLRSWGGGCWCIVRAGIPAATWQGSEREVVSHPHRYNVFLQHSGVPNHDCVLALTSARATCNPLAASIHFSYTPAQNQGALKHKPRQAKIVCRYPSPIQIVFPLQTRQ